MSAEPLTDAELDALRRQLLDMSRIATIEETRLLLTIERLREERDERDDFILREGYRRCDISACNCGSWHGGTWQRRLYEIRDALNDADVPLCGNLTVDRTKALVSERDSLRAELAAEKAEGEELRATLANERGEGPPPSKGWHYSLGRQAWVKQPWLWTPPGPKIESVAYLLGYVWLGQVGGEIVSKAPHARAAMIAADLALAALGRDGSTP
jgi:hypothetical protein